MIVLTYIAIILNTIISIITILSEEKALNKIISIVFGLILITPYLYLIHLL